MGEALKTAMNYVAARAESVERRGKGREGLGAKGDENKRRRKRGGEGSAAGRGEWCARWRHASVYARSDETLAGESELARLDYPIPRVSPRQRRGCAILSPAFF